MQPLPTTTRRRRRAVLVLAGAVTATVVSTLTPSVAAADPSTAAQARTLVEQAGQRLAEIDEQLNDAQLTVAELQQDAETAAQRFAVAQAAVDAYEPQLRAIAQTGYTGPSQSRVAAFLTSDDASELVQQLTTLDLIAAHVEGLMAQVAVAQDQAEQAKAAADQAAAKARAALAELQEQQAQAQQQVDAYRADFQRLSAEEQAAVTTALAGPSLAAPSTAAVVASAPSASVATVLRTALAQRGDPYVWGSSGPDGFDCSGLTRYAFAAAGIDLPHSSGAQSQMGRAVSRSELQPGDLVFFYSPVSHVGIYIGNGQMVHASTYGQPVQVVDLAYMPGFNSARRLA